jgi:hypothetical protein
VKIGGGSALLPRVTATGCALGALVAAHIAAAPDSLTGLVSAHVHFSVVAELAEAVASRPGSFAAAFIDALDAVDENSLRSREDPTAGPHRVTGGQVSRGRPVEEPVKKPSVSRDLSRYSTGEAPAPRRAARLIDPPKS